MLNAKLVVVGGDAKKTEVQLKLPTVIGRGKEAGLTVPHALVSRRHTEIFEREGQLFVRDLGSLNGTYVNNTRIEGDEPLEPDQLLTLGNITFRAVYEVESRPPLSAATSTETISIDEAKTLSGDLVLNKDVLQIQTADGKAQTSSISDVISFDETVPVDLISEEDKPVDASKANSAPETKPENNGQQAPARRQDPVEKPTDPIIFKDDDQVDNPGAGDTDKSIVDATTSDGSAIGSSFFSFETETVDPANKSVSLSALEDLPSGQSAVSVFGNVETDDDIKKPISHLNPVELDLGEDEKKAQIEADSTLGSFLKKLPR
jgi:pSer/pThr/pTyr-binding forkhead associated (FHA) protein